MSSDTPIEWADDSTSAWWGCTHVSPGCAHCYAETMAARFKRGSWGAHGERALRVDACLADLARFARRGIREGRPRRVFLGSMCDVFDQHPDLVEPRKRLWDGLHALREGAHVLVLTKRAAEMATWAREHGWPAACWAGVSVEDQRRADERIPYLLTVPAAVRFVSAEPLLSGLDLAQWLRPHRCGCSSMWLDGCGIHSPQCREGQRDIAQVIVGGESGPGARPMNPTWARSLRDQCESAGTAYFFKQWGEWAPLEWSCGIDAERGRVSTGDGYPDGYKWVAYHRFEDGREMARIGKREAGRLLDGRTWDEMPEVTRD